MGFRGKCEHNEKEMEKDPNGNHTSEKYSVINDKFTDGIKRQEHCREKCKIIDLHDIAICIVYYPKYTYYILPNTHYVLSKYILYVTQRAKCLKKGD